VAGDLLTRLRRLDVAVGWAQDQIPPPLFTLAVIKGWLYEKPSTPAELDWCRAVVMQFDAAASQYVLRLHKLSFHPIYASREDTARTTRTRRG